MGSSDEVVAEISHNGVCCLLSVRGLMNGRLCVEVYRADNGVEVRCDPSRLGEYILEEITGKS